LFEHDAERIQIEIWTDNMNALSLGDWKERNHKMGKDSSSWDYDYVVE
jgi:hypothetical protein